METTLLEPDSELATARTIPIVALGWAALTGWAARKGPHNDWQPLWLYPPLLAVMGAVPRDAVWFRGEPQSGRRRGDLADVGCPGLTGLGRHIARVGRAPGS